MALPAGIQTCEVTFGPFLTFTGAPIGGNVQFVPSRQIIWLATGAPLMPDPITVNLDSNALGFVNLPYTNQSGFGTGNGQAVTDWTYRAVVKLNGANSPPNVTFSLPLGPTTVDLDLLTPSTFQVPTFTSLPTIGALILGPTDPIPTGTPPGTVIFRTT